MIQIEVDNQKGQNSQSTGIQEIDATIVSSRNKWKIATIILSVLIVLAIIGVVVLKFTNLL